jgi:hypothetical protein
MFALSNYTTFSQTQIGVTVPLTVPKGWPNSANFLAELDENSCINMKHTEKVNDPSTFKPLKLNNSVQL